MGSRLSLMKGSSSLSSLVEWCWRIGIGGKVSLGSRLAWHTPRLAHGSLGSHLAWLTARLAHSSLGTHLAWLACSRLASLTPRFALLLTPRFAHTSLRSPLTPSFARSHLASLAHTSLRFASLRFAHTSLRFASLRSLAHTSFRSHLSSLTPLSRHFGI